MTNKVANAASLAPPSAFRELIGVKVSELYTDRAIIKADVIEATMNYVGRLHGGVVAWMIDMAGALAGGYADYGERVRPALTVSFTVSFLGTAFSGIIRATGRKTGGGKQVFGATVEITDETGRIFATGQGNHMYMQEV